LFKEVQKTTNVAIIFITHDFGVVANMCHRVAVMYTGKIMETAPTHEIFKAPLHPYTIALIHSVPRLDRKDERLYAIEGQPPSLRNLPPGCRFFSRCRQAFDRCSSHEPPMVEVAPDHQVACWKVQ
jgi:oligopeptide/dipeptide ABC transporter ATP-binding protein